MTSRRPRCSYCTLRDGSGRQRSWMRLEIGGGAADNDLFFCSLYCLADWAESQGGGSQPISA